MANTKPKMRAEKQFEIFDRMKNTGNFLTRDPSSKTHEKGAGIIWKIQRKVCPLLDERIKTHIVRCDQATEKAKGAQGNLSARCRGESLGAIFLEELMAR